MNQCNFNEFTQYAIRQGGAPLISITLSHDMTRIEGPYGVKHTRFLLASVAEDMQ